MILALIHLTFHQLILIDRILIDFDDNHIEHNHGHLFHSFTWSSYIWFSKAHSHDNTGYNE